MGSKFSDKCPQKGQKRSPSEDRDLSDAIMAKEHLKSPEAKRGKDTSSKAPRLHNPADILILDFWERTHFYCFKPRSLWYFFRENAENEYSPKLSRLISAWSESPLGASRSHGPCHQKWGALGSPVSLLWTQVIKVSFVVFDHRPWREFESDGECRVMWFVIQRATRWEGTNYWLAQQREMKNNCWK